MVKGVGIDIIEISRIKENMTKEAFIARLFTPEEIVYCRGKARPEIHFAGRFAAKEAVLKALGTGLRGMKWLDIEILADGKGMPVVRLGPAAEAAALGQGIKNIMVSISHSNDYAVAYAMALQG